MPVAPAGRTRSDSRTRGGHPQSESPARSRPEMQRALGLFRAAVLRARGGASPPAGCIARPPRQRPGRTRGTRSPGPRTGAAVPRPRARRARAQAPDPRLSRPPGRRGARARLHPSAPPGLRHTRLNPSRPHRRPGPPSDRQGSAEPFPRGRAERGAGARPRHAPRARPLRPRPSRPHGVPRGASTLPRPLPPHRWCTPGSPARRASARSARGGVHRAPSQPPRRQGLRPLPPRARSAPPLGGARALDQEACRRPLCCAAWHSPLKAVGQRRRRARRHLRARADAPPWEAYAPVTLVFWLDRAGPAGVQRSSTPPSPG